MGSSRCRTSSPARRSNIRGSREPGEPGVVPQKTGGPLFHVKRAMEVVTGQSGSRRRNKMFHVKPSLAVDAPCRQVRRERTSSSTRRISAPIHPVSGGRYRRNDPRDRPTDPRAGRPDRFRGARARRLAGRYRFLLQDRPGAFSFRRVLRAGRLASLQGQEGFCRPQALRCSTDRPLRRPTTPDPGRGFRHGTRERRDPPRGLRRRCGRSRNPRGDRSDESRPGRHGGPGL